VSTEGYRPVRLPWAKLGQQVAFKMLSTCSRTVPWVISELYPTGAVWRATNPRWIETGWALTS